MTETKKKAPSMARLTIVLFVITAISALLLGLVNNITAEEIAAKKVAKTNDAMREVLPAASQFEELKAPYENGLVTAVLSGGDAGYVFQVSTSGFGGMIDMVVGVDGSGAVTGVAIVSMSETSGLGSNAANEDWRAQFTGINGSASLSKEGGAIDALTGATVTSRAVLVGVNAALDVFGQIS